MSVITCMISRSPSLIVSRSLSSHGWDMYQHWSTWLYQNGLPTQIILKRLMWISNFLGAIQGGLVIWCWYFCRRSCYEHIERRSGIPFYVAPKDFIIIKYVEACLISWLNLFSDVTCEEKEFRCNSGQCIKKEWRCNTIEGDCKDGSDEKGCEGMHMRWFCP